MTPPVESGGWGVAGGGSLEWLHTLAEVEAVAEEWSGLWERCPGATPFQSPEWLLPWWRHLGRGRLQVLTLREGGRLVGLAPLFRTPGGRVCLLGTGNTDYLDVLVDPSYPDAAARLLAGATEGAGLCDLQQLRPSSPLLGAAIPAGCRAATLAQEVCPVLPLPPSPEAWWEGLSPKLRSNLRYYRKRLEREGAVEVADAATLEPALEALFRLHGARWRKRKLPGVFGSPQVRKFHHEAAAGFLRRGWLRLYTLRHRGETVAALYCFAARGRTYYYAGGFDPEYRNLSPGTVLTGHAIQQAVQEGCAEFDFLRGDEPYKYGWGAVDRQNTRLVVWKDGIGRAWVPGWVRTEQAVETWIKRWARETFR